MSEIKQSNHSNIPQTIGNFYHYYIVVDKLFELEENEKIIIELHGDITRVSKNEKVFIENCEIKHHEADNELNYTNEDFWKTLKNWINDIENYQKDTKLILHTTSKLHKGLDNFEIKKVEEKIYLLKDWKSKTKNKKILEHQQVIFRNEENLKFILNKVLFKSEQVDYVNIKQDIIKKHRDYFECFDDENIKLNAIETFVTIIINSLESNKKWEIDYEYFKNKRNEFINKNQSTKKIIDENDLYENSHDELATKDLKKEYLYVKKLQDIELDEEEILNASINKYRALKFADILLNHKQSVYTEKILSCKEIFKNEWKNKKPIYKRKMKQLSQIESSQSFYEELSKTQKLCLHDEDNTQSFRRGYWHILADDEDEKIHWLIEDKK
ncbi:MAG: hypothetical protein Q7R95_03055 [bacterium]|nr:hypothetical protein [bacterium]